MNIKAYAAGFCAAVIAATALAVSPVEAQTSQTAKKYTNTRSAKADRPRSRVVVAPRSFLDAGVEVRPGERKFTDYAYPVGNAGLGINAVTNVGGRVGWDTNPMMTGPELGGFNRW